MLQQNRYTDVVVIHDGARPFINDKIIAECIEAALEHGVSTVAVPVKDTVKISEDGDFVEETLERSKLWAIQTPQAFKYDVLISAHKRAAEDGFIGTDDTVLAERLGFKTRLVMGSYNNIKITTKEDLAFAEAIVNSILK